MTVYDDTRTATWPEVTMTDAERQALAKRHQRTMRTARTKVRNLVRDNLRRPVDEVEGLRAAYERLSEAVYAAFDAFDTPGMYWPDNWHEYKRAQEDVETALRYGMALWV